MERVPIKIIFEDEHLIVIEKREGLLSVSTSRGKEELTAHRLVNNWLQNTSMPRKMERDREGGKRGRWEARREEGGRWGNSANRRDQSGRWQQAPRAYIVHRLDRETSGLMVFAKSEEIKHRMQENWDSMVTHRGYVAVVNGAPESDEGTIRTWLRENSAFIVYSSPKNNGGQLAITNYKVLEYNSKERKSLIELELETGRKNQIRVHMQELGCPIYGDKKYYGGNPHQLAESKKARRLHLHAHILNFIHPVTGKEMKFTTGIPRAFRQEV